MKETEIPHSPEIESSPEVIAQKLIARIDQGLQELGVPPRDARAWGWCNFVPDAVNYCALQDGQEKGYEVEVAVYQAQDLHLMVVDKPALRSILSSPSVAHNPDPESFIHDITTSYYEDPVIRDVCNTTFGHGFNVVEINGTPFLIDLSFSQFIGPDGMLVQAGDNKNSGISSDHPLAQQLLRDGCIPLSDENLRTYMRFMCTYEPDYLKDVTTDLLQRVKVLPFAMDDNELMGRIPPAYKPVEPGSEIR